jgi:hypothetical protein
VPRFIVVNQGVDRSTSRAIDRFLRMHLSLQIEINRLAAIWRRSASTNGRSEPRARRIEAGAGR